MTFSRVKHCELPPGFAKAIDAEDFAGPVAYTRRVIDHDPDPQTFNKTAAAAGVSGGTGFFRANSTGSTFLYHLDYGWGPTFGFLSGVGHDIHLPNHMARVTAGHTKRTPSFAYPPEATDDTFLAGCVACWTLGEIEVYYTEAGSIRESAILSPAQATALEQSVGPSLAWKLCWRG